MGCSHEIIKEFQLNLDGEPILVKGLDSMVHLTFLSQPQSEADIKDMMYDAYLEYNEPFNGEIDRLKQELFHAYMEMKRELEDRIRRYRVVKGSQGN